MSFRGEMREFLLQKILEISYTKIVHKWNGYPEIFSRPQAMENSRQFLLLRTDIL